MPFQFLSPFPTINLNSLFGLFYFVNGIFMLILPQLADEAIFLIDIGNLEAAYLCVFGVMVCRLGVTYIGHGLIGSSHLFVAVSIVHRAVIYVPLLVTLGLKQWLTFTTTVGFIAADAVGIAGLVIIHAQGKAKLLPGMSYRRLIPYAVDPPFNPVLRISGVVDLLFGVIAGYALFGVSAEVLTGLPTELCSSSLRAFVAMSCGMSMVVGYHDLVLSPERTDSRRSYVAVAIVARVVVGSAIAAMYMLGYVTGRFAAIVAVKELVFGLSAIAMSLRPDQELAKDE